MVEQWSSKPYAWVRFLLSLFIPFLLKTKAKLNKNKILKKNSIKNIQKNKKFYFYDQKLSTQIKKSHVVKYFRNLPPVTISKNLIIIFPKRRNKITNNAILSVKSKKNNLNLLLKNKS